jgi:hypothetical protein
MALAARRASGAIHRVTIAMLAPHNHVLRVDCCSRRTFATVPFAPPDTGFNGSS